MNEELQIKDLKGLIYGIIAEEGHLTGFVNSKRIALYACLEIADACLEIAAELNIEVFSEAIYEILDTYTNKQD